MSCATCPSPPTTGKWSPTPYSAGLRVKDGDTVEKGFQLTEGACPHEVLRIRGLSACHNYLIREVLYQPAGR